MAKNMSDYVNDAKGQLQGQYDQYKNQATINHNQQQSNYDQSIKDTGMGFDKAKENAVSQGKQNQNQYNNNTLSRGMGRSSIATTGLAGIQNTTDKNLSGLDLQRENELAKISTLKNQLTESYNSNMIGFDKDLESKANQLAQDLKRYDDDMSYREWQKQQADLDRQWQQQQAAVEQQRWEQELAWKREQAMMEQRRWEQQQASRNSGYGSSSGTSSSGGGTSSTGGGSPRQPVTSLNTVKNAPWDKKNEAMYYSPIQSNILGNPLAEKKYPKF